MAQHAKLSPSGADRWMNCPGSVELCSSILDTSNAAADEGTACHTLLAEHLTRGLVLDKAVGSTLLVTDEGRKPAEVYVTEEMVDAVKDVVRWVNAYRLAHQGALVWSESKVNMGKVFGCPDDLWGTADVVFAHREEVCVLDAKFGYNDVPVADNPQLILYAIGVAADFAWDYAQYRLVIHQPRSGGAKVVVYTREDLQRYVIRYHPLVKRALEPDQPLVPGDVQCTWCPAHGICPRFEEQARALAVMEWSKPELMLPEKLAEVLAVADRIRAGLKAAEEHALRMLMLGQKVPGWKPVEGDKHRVWKDEVSAQRVLRNLGYGDDDIRPRKMLSPAQAEKLSGAKNQLEPFITKPKGAPKLAREDDPKPALPPDFTPEEKK